MSWNYWKDLFDFCIRLNSTGFKQNKQLFDVFTIGEKYIGRLESIIPTGSNDVYVVKDDATEILIPALASVVLDIDLDRKRMLVQLPEGL